MATPINAPLAGEIWHLSIEDLFQPVQEAPRLGGDGPFVINLSVSTAPISVPTKSFANRRDVHVYQIQVTEDGRTRYRLRFGPFITEDDADAMLAEVRDTYPGALTATASSSDLRVIESMEAKANQRQATQKAADKVVIEKSVSQKIAAEKIAPQKVVPQAAAPQKPAPPDATEKPTPQKAAPPKAAPPKTGPDMIEAAVRAEIARVDAEISIDIAWPTPELKVPDAPMRAAPTAPAPIVKAPAPPVIAKEAPPVIAKEVPHVIAKEAPPVAKAMTPPVQATASSAAKASTAWHLPELDIPLPAAQKRAAAPAAPVIAEPAAPPPKSFELTLVSDAPVLTEVVVPRRAPLKNALQKPVVAAPVLTEAVVSKVKASTASAVSAPAPAKPTPMATPAPAPVAAAAKPVAPPMPTMPTMRTTAPAAVAPAVIATVAAPVASAPIVPAPVIAAPIVPAPTVAAAVAVPVPAPVVVAAAPIIATPTPAVSQVAAPPAAVSPAVAPPPSVTAPSVTASKSVAPPAPPKAAPPKPSPVLTQSLASPRRGSAAKLRTALTKLGANKLTSLQHVVVATAPVPAPREVKKLDEPLPDLESTQTIRALTPKELEDSEVSRWFVIQLAIADHAFDPDAVPNLDIFSEYRLYSVAGLDQGRVVHALRLGFFREEIGAVAVASYLGTYWDKPTIKRVSLAERERFADQRVEARKDVGATGRHSVIEITDELVARRRRTTKALTATLPSNRPVEH